MVRIWVVQGTVLFVRAREIVYVDLFSPAGGGAEPPSASLLRSSSPLTPSCSRTSPFLVSRRFGVVTLAGVSTGSAPESLLSQGTEMSFGGWRVCRHDFRDDEVTISSSSSSSTLSSFLVFGLIQRLEARPASGSTRSSLLRLNRSSLLRLNRSSLLRLNRSSLLRLNRSSLLRLQTGAAFFGCRPRIEAEAELASGVTFESLSWPALRACDLLRREACASMSSSWNDGSTGAEGAFEFLSWPALRTCDLLRRGSLHELLIVIG